MDTTARPSSRQNPRAPGHGAAMQRVACRRGAAAPGPRRFTGARQSGVALLELALVATLMLVVLFATIEFGRALTQYKQIVAQVNAAARYLATRPVNAGTAEATCLVRFGVIATTCSGTPLIIGLDTATVTVTGAGTTPATQRRQRTTATLTDLVGVRVNLVTVTVTGFRYRLVASGILNPVFGNVTSIPFPAIAATHRQFIN